MRAERGCAGWRAAVAARLAGGLAAALVLLGLAGPARAQPAQPPASAAAPAAPPPVAGADCALAADAFARVRCRGALRVGLRTQYPPFAAIEHGELQGFEVDLAREIAGRLQVGLEIVPVTPANRIAALGEGRADLVIATMGHTVQRDAEALFVRPHYYQSRTVLVGRRGLNVSGMEALRGRSVCVTVGNNTNADLSAAGARLMLYDRASQLVDQLRQGGCSLAAQDDSFFATWLSQPDFAARFEVYFGFGGLPWGMAVSRADGARLHEWLQQQMVSLHAQGRLRALASPHGVDTPFLQAEQRRWTTPPCDDSSGLRPAGCLFEPRDNQLAPTAFAGTVAAVERDILSWTGLKVTLAMLKTRVAFELFLQGLLFTTLLMVGAVCATPLFGALLAHGLGSRWRLVAWPMRSAVAMLQSTPLILLLFLAGILTSASGTPSAALCLAAAVLMLGLFNGAHTGQALAEARARLRAGAGGAPVPMARAFLQTRAQVVAFAVNAARGSPAASLIGVPEVLSALTDIASFSSERVTTYLVLLVLYMLMTALVFRVAAWLQPWLDRRLQARAG
jgi:ABC-type amino acid transport substrate-binding protein/ABC-type amino acid transport system permease subunit